MNRRGLMRFVLPIALLLSGCAIEALPADPPVPDRVTFNTVIYPILMRDCGFPDCHGNNERFFRVYGPGRARLEEGQSIDGAVTTGELDASYDRARSMLAGARSAEESLLLRKPLEIGRGGAPHQGIDEHGQDVYRSTEPTGRPGYPELLVWAQDAFARGS